MTLLAKLMKRVSPEPNTGCWLWMGNANKDGYGLFGMGGKQKVRSNRLAHRVVYEAIRGPIASDLSLDHLCRVRCCVNPQHLEPVPIQENIRRALPTHCRRGHLYDEANTHRFKGDKWRHCRQCALLKIKRCKDHKQIP